MNSRKNEGFTLAEVLITIAIVGVIAALTIPLVIRNYQKTAMKTQFKKVYSTLQNGWLKAQADMGYQPDCYYWATSPYGGAVCVTRDPNTGYCTKYTMPDGSNLPSDYNGNFGECTKFKDQLLGTLGVAKTCKTNALSGGCIPENSDNDTHYADLHNDADDYTVGSAISDAADGAKAIFQTQESWVLRDGTIVLFYSGPHIFAVDINVKTNPNKWGHDVFEFRTAGDKNSHLRLIPGGCMPVESGGVSTATMLKDSLK
jgi:prepilin-type N-terminal cleavage/methylation domain-containing protein